MQEPPALKDSLAKALVDAPGHIVRYVGGLIVALLGDYTLITLLIFVGLLGWLLGSVLIAATTFFGAYFVLRLVANLAESIGFHANQTRLAGNQQAQSNMQIAAALAQFRTPHEAQSPTLEQLEAQERWADHKTELMGDTQP